MTLDEVIAKIRDFLRDYPELNELLEARENSDELLKLSVEYILNDFNQQPPISNHTVENFPSIPHLVLGAAAYALQSAMVWYSRNRINISDGGISLMYKDKAGEYASIVGGFMEQYMRWKMLYKKGKNLEDFYGIAWDR
jgi:hypothetical protein